MSIAVLLTVNITILMTFFALYKTKTLLEMGWLRNKMSDLSI